MASSRFLPPGGAVNFKLMPFFVFFYSKSLKFIRAQNERLYLITTSFKDTAPTYLLFYPIGVIAFVLFSLFISI